MVRRLADSTRRLHGREPGPFRRREVWVSQPTDRAVVLGSAQSDAIVDAAVAARLGLDVVRRRSGGGAVLIEPGDIVWIDILLPRGDERWVEDVGRSFAWLGAAWQRALEHVGVAGAEVHAGPMVANEASTHVCFAGRGPGEVLVGSQKVVGLSQRRTRRGARFQCAALLAWAPQPLLEVFHRVGADDPEFGEVVRGCARGIPAPRDLLVDAVLDALI